MRRALVAIVLMGAMACGAGETTAVPESESSEEWSDGSRITVPLLPAVDGIVRDGREVLDNSVVQALHVPGFEDRGVIEFDVRGIAGPVLKATLVLPVFAANGPYPFRIDVYGYWANGRLQVEDWDRGTRVRSFMYAGEPVVKLDVTAKVLAMRSKGATHAGFVLHFAEPSDIADNGPFLAIRSLEYRPAAGLRIVTR
jgi:hypothetical protein